MSQNITEYFSVPRPLNFPPEIVAVHIFGMIICIPAILGSISVVWTTLLRKDITPHLILIISLCIGDLILGLTQFVVIGVNLVNNGWIDIMECTIEAFMVCLSAQASVISFVLIAVERYLVICHGWQQHTRAVLTMLFIAWAIAIGISAALVSSPDYIALQHTMLSCAPDPTVKQPMVVGMVPAIIFECFGAMFAIGYCYYSIFTIYTENNDVKLKGVLSLFWVNKKNEVTYRSLTKNEQKILYKLITMTVVFVFMILPFTFAFLYSYHMGTNIVDDYPSLLWFDYFYGYLLALNSSTNSIMLYLMDPEVKNQIRNFFGMNTQVVENFEKPSVAIPPPESYNSGGEVPVPGSPIILLASLRMVRRTSRNAEQFGKSTASLFPSTILSSPAREPNRDSLRAEPSIKNDLNWISDDENIENSQNGSKLF